MKTPRGHSENGFIFITNPYSAWQVWGDSGYICNWFFMDQCSDCKINTGPLNKHKELQSRKRFVFVEPQSWTREGHWRLLIHSGYDQPAGNPIIQTLVHRTRVTSKLNSLTRCKAFINIKIITIIVVQVSWRVTAFCSLNRSVFPESKALASAPLVRETLAQSSCEADRLLMLQVHQIHHAETRHQGPFTQAAFNLNLPGSVNRTTFGNGSLSGYFLLWTPVFCVDARKGKAMMSMPAGMSLTASPSCSPQCWI